MKILYVLKEDPIDAVKSIMDEHKKDNDVTVVDIRKNKNYDEIIGLIEQNDKIISA